MFPISDQRNTTTIIKTAWLKRYTAHIKSQQGCGWSLPP